MTRARRSLKSKTGPIELTPDNPPVINAKVMRLASTLGAQAARKYLAECARAGILDPSQLTDAELRERLTDALFSLSESGRPVRKVDVADEPERQRAGLIFLPAQERARG